jgi:hypothetical protein
MNRLYNDNTNTTCDYAYKGGIATTIDLLSHHLPNHATGNLASIAMNGGSCFDHTPPDTRAARPLYSIVTRRRVALRKSVIRHLHSP